MPTTAEIQSQINSFGQTYNVGSGVSTVSTVGSTAADAGSGDQRDDNIRQINNIVIDVAALNDQMSRLIETLRERNLIPD